MQTGYGDMEVQASTYGAAVAETPSSLGYGRTQPANPVWKAPREITIEKVLNGFFVKVGCQNVVFETAEKMLKEIGRYYSNPSEVENEYLKKANA